MSCSYCGLVCRCGANMRKAEEDSQPVCEYHVEFITSTDYDLTFRSEAKLKRWLDENKYKRLSKSVPGRWTQQLRHHTGKMVDITRVPILPKRLRPSPYKG